ncbi:MAG: hypothetical protein ACOCVL_01795 [Candidatus Sumerlaeota bacterium]
MRTEKTVIDVKVGPYREVFSFLVGDKSATLPAKNANGPMTFMHRFPANANLFLPLYYSTTFKPVKQQAARRTGKNLHHDKRSAIFMPGKREKPAMPSSPVAAY